MEKERTCRDCGRYRACIERNRMIPCTDFRPATKKELNRRKKKEIWKRIRRIQNRFMLWWWEWGITGEDATGLIAAASPIAFVVILAILGSLA